MTYFHQGSPDYQPVWIDQVPGYRPDDVGTAGQPPDEEQPVDPDPPSPRPEPIPPTTFNVFDEDALVDDAAVRDQYKAPLRTAVQRLNALVGYSQAQITALRASYTAGDTWNGVRFHDQPVNVNFGGVVAVNKVHYFEQPTDAPHTVAFCARVLPRQGGDNQLSQSIILGINTLVNKTDAEWAVTMAHELCHGLGIGAASWPARFVDTANSLLINGYPNALAAYRDLVSQNRSSILLEAEGGPGTANSHWENGQRDGVPGFRNEIMIGINVPDDAIVSSLTLECLRDQGYQIIGEPEGTPDLVNVRQAPVSFGMCDDIEVIYD